MEQDKIGKFIKKIRLEHNLSQEKFGEKYGVSYQAVSKWENGKNLPDIAILQEICNDYNIDFNELFGRKKVTKSYKLIILLVICIIIFGVTSYLIIRHNNQDFYFKTIDTNCDDFKLYGSIAYNSNKTSIYISNITYCGQEDDTIYNKISCTLYELDANTKTKIDSYEENNISLTNFLENVRFNVEHYSENCKMIKENGMILEIEASLNDGKINLYTIPLKLKNNCD